MSRRYVEETAQLPCWSAGVTPEERVTHTPLPSTNKAEPTLALNPGETSPEIQNR